MNFTNTDNPNAKLLVHMYRLVLNKVCYSIYHQVNTNVSWNGFNFLVDIQYEIFKEIKR